MTTLQSRPRFKVRIEPRLTPAGIPGLQFWYKADAITGVSDGATITTWPDQSGNGHDATVTGGTLTYRTNQLNGKPAVAFASSGYLTIASASSIASTDEHTAFAVLQLTSPASKGDLFGGPWTGGPAPFCYWFGGSKLQGVDCESIIFVGTGTAAPDTVWHQMSTVFAGAFSTPGFVLQFRKDGADDAAIVNAATGNNASPPAVIGRNDHTGTEYFNGNIAEIVYYNRILTSAEVAQVEGYLHSAYFVPPSPTPGTPGRLWPYQSVYPWVRTNGTVTDQSRLWLNALYRTVATNGGGGGGFTAGGDLSGTNTVQTVIGLQTRPISSTAPADMQVLTWVGADGMWEPKAAAVSVVIRETPSGTMNGTNKTFTLSFAPNPAASLTLWLNGVEQIPTVDYTISGATVTYVVAPKSADLMIAQYSH